MATNPNYQREYYQRHRERRIAESNRYQQEHREERRQYMREWCERNREHRRDYARRTADQRNARRRERYATDERERAKKRAEVKNWQQRNPDKRLAQRLKPFGITPADYYRILAEQGGCCAICGRPDSGDSRQHRFHVDHCHETKTVRGILCASCNLGIGKFGDDPERLERAAVYLRAARG